MSKVVLTDGTVIYIDNDKKKGKKKDKKKGKKKGKKKSVSTKKNIVPGFDFAKIGRNFEFGDTKNE